MGQLSVPTDASLQTINMDKYSIKSISFMKITTSNPVYFMIGLGIVSNMDNCEQFYLMLPWDRLRFSYVCRECSQNRD